MHAGIEEGLLGDPLLLLQLIQHAKQTNKQTNKQANKLIKQANKLIKTKLVCGREAYVVRCVCSSILLEKDFHSKWATTSLLL